MLVLVTGGAASGKSAHAERLLVEKTDSGARVYLAAMQPFGAEAQKRMARHRAMRASKGFDTVERYTDLAGLTLAKKYDGALLEDVSNLTANEIFAQEGAGLAHAAEAVLCGVDALARQVDTLVLVTNEVFSDGHTYDAQTMHFLATLAQINRVLAARADAVYESVCGILLAVKGEKVN